MNRPQRVVLVVALGVLVVIVRSLVIDYYAGEEDGEFNPVRALLLGLRFLDLTLLTAWVVASAVLLRRW